MIGTSRTPYGNLESGESGQAEASENIGVPDVSEVGRKHGALSVLRDDQLRRLESRCNCGMTGGYLGNRRPSVGAEPRPGVPITRGHVVHGRRSRGLGGIEAPLPDVGQRAHPQEADQREA